MAECAGSEWRWNHPAEIRDHYGYKAFSEPFVQFRPVQHGPGYHPTPDRPDSCVTNVGQPQATQPYRVPSKGLPDRRLRNEI